MSSGIRSGRVDNIWPNLTNMGPSASSAKRRRSPRDNFLGTGARRQGASQSAMRNAKGNCSVGMRSSKR